MMAAAYAALVSLLNTLDQIQIHPLLSASFFDYTNINKSLGEKIDLFLDFVEKFSDAEEAKDLVKRIADVAHEAEDIIEIQAARVAVRLRKYTRLSQSFLSSLQRIIDDMDSIKEQIIKINEGTGNRHPTSSSAPMVDNNSEAEDFVRRMAAVVALDAHEHSPSVFPDMQNTKEDMDSFKKRGSKNQQPAASSSSSAKTTNMVGFDGYLEQLLDQLTRQPSCRKILPVVGMGGVGKTTLARNVYDNSLIVEHFYVRAWVTVSQEFSVSEILLKALSCLGGPTCETHRTSGQLGEELHKILYGRRYLIVLDDVWSVEAWDKIKSFFPENNNGSRIVITTRQSKLVNYFGSSALVVDFLDDKNSWGLFCEKTFPQQDCPPELVEIGKKIVVKCKGLPLAIVVVGGFLGKSPRTLAYWEEIAKDKSLIHDSGEGNDASGILYLSYKHMPIWLKSCFLYLGLFPEDYHIKVSQLIQLWVAEGFIKASKDQTVEEVAENYMNELVDRNLVLVGELRSTKKLKTCLVHDLVRDLCLRIAENENFVCAKRGIDGKRHFIVDERSSRFSLPQSHKPSLVLPLILDGQITEPSNSRLLRVLFSHGRTPDHIEEVNLRLLIHQSSSPVYTIPPSVSRLWGLQTLIVTGYERVIAPREIWEMPQLRHINIKGSVSLPHPSRRYNMSVLENLHTLVTVKDLILTEEVCKRIPNIKKFDIIYKANTLGDEASHLLDNVGCFSKLESLRCSGNGYKCAGDFFRNLKFPSSLKKLCLERCKLGWSDVEMIASLPHLQTLNLLTEAVFGVEWNCVGVEFVCLKHLKIHDAGLIYWSADSSSFPVLETLSLKHLSKLEEIPSDIGEVPTLQKIQMYECSKSANFSVVKIAEEQESLGNLGLQLEIMFFLKSKAEKLWEEIKELDITCQNLRIYESYVF